MSTDLLIDIRKMLHFGVRSDASGRAYFVSLSEPNRSCISRSRHTVAADVSTKCAY